MKPQPPPPPSLGGAPILTVRQGARDGVRVVHVAGELDISSSGQLDDALAEACSTPPDAVVVDVSEVTFMDASGLDVLAAARRRLHEAGRAGLVVRGASGIVRRVFEITQLTSWLEHPRTTTAPLAPIDGSMAAETDDFDVACRHARLSVTEDGDIVIVRAGRGAGHDPGPACWPRRFRRQQPPRWPPVDPDINVFENVAMLTTP